MRKIWEWAEEKLTTEEMKNEMLLRTDNEGGTAWHLAAYRGEQDVMQKIWDWAKEKLTTEEIKNVMTMGE
jgi:endo-1,4-beta-D-glucanase Y